MDAVLSATKRNAEGLLVIALGVFLACYVERLVGWFANLGSGSTTALFQGMLGWASIEAGFLFAAYTFLAAGSSSFIVAIQSTRAFVSFKEYIINTLYASFAVSGISLYLSITNIDIGKDGSGRFILVAFIASSLWIVLRFLKIIRVFRKLDSARPPNLELDLAGNAIDGVAPE